MKLELQKPSLKMLPSYLEFIEEMAAIGEKIWDSQRPKGHETHEEYVQKLLAAETGLGENDVPENVYWTVLDGVVVGRIALRHHLTENLKEFGGHIGYEVRPSYRKRGIATEMLRLVLQTPKAQDIGEFLLTCSPDNIGSNKTITANGGTLKNTAFVERVQRSTNYYWIILP